MHLVFKVCLAETKICYDVETISKQFHSKL